MKKTVLAAALLTASVSAQAQYYVDPAESATKFYQEAETAGYEFQSFFEESPANMQFVQGTSRYYKQDRLSDDGRVVAQFFNKEYVNADGISYVCYEDTCVEKNMITFMIDVALNPVQPVSNWVCTNPEYNGSPAAAMAIDLAKAGKYSAGDALYTKSMSGDRIVIKITGNLDGVGKSGGFSITSTDNTSVSCEYK